MRIDIWSDMMCPFCYIGKRRLEGALTQFEHADGVQIVWHSFQLDPTMKEQPGKDLYTYLAERKGQSLEWSKKVHNQLTQTASEAGLTYNFDKAVIANSFDAHRLVQLAKQHDLGDAAEERLFSAYFTEGRNIADHNTLMQLGMEIGLRAVELGEMLNSDAYAAEVNADVQQAEAIGISGVPFFVIDNKYAVSGAQPQETFRDALQYAWKEYEQASLNIANDAACTPDGTCEPEL